MFRFRGENRFKHFRLRDAVSDFDRAIELTPAEDRSALFQLRGMTHRYLGEYDQAQADSEEALRLRPGWGRGESNLAWTLLLRGDVAQAHEHFSRALAIEVKPTRLVEHAFTSWMRGEDDTASKEYEKACESSSFENACLWAWEIEARRGKTRAADRLLELARTRASEDRRAFVAALVAYARAPRDRRSSRAGVTALAREESQMLGRCVFGCVAAAGAGRRRLDLVHEMRSHPGLGSSDLAAGAAGRQSRPLLRV